MKARRYERLQRRYFDLCNDWAIAALGKLGARS
jgi:hypothetical protein